MRPDLEGKQNTAELAKKDPRELLKQNPQGLKAARMSNTKHFYRSNTLDSWRIVQLLQKMPEVEECLCVDVGAMPTSFWRLKNPVHGKKKNIPVPNKRLCKKHGRALGTKEITKKNFESEFFEE